MLTDTVFCMQVLLPRCNVAVMVQLQPQMFLAKSAQQIEAQVGSAYEIIQRDLPTSYVDHMIQVRCSFRWPACCQNAKAGLVPAGTAQVPAGTAQVPDIPKLCPNRLHAFSLLE
jgi:hypothetical protein